jgi:UDP-glucose 4-epimerase
MILVTGVTGFIGKHLLSALIKQYGRENIVALTSKPVSGCSFLLHNNYSFKSDFFVTSGFSEIETVIHAGAFIPKNSQQANDLSKCNSNIVNTAALLNAEFPKLRKILYLSTVDVYGPANVISEESTIGPVSLYGDSKLYCERMIAAWANEKTVTCHILRVGHVYGPGEEAYQKIIPVTIKKLIDKESIQVWSDGSEIRSFINIKDIVAAVVKATELEESAGVINLVSSEQTTIKDLVYKIIEISGIAADIVFGNTNITGRNLVFNNAKMKQHLLEAELPLEQGLIEEWNYMKPKVE